MAGDWRCKLDPERRGQIEKWYDGCNTEKWYDGCIEEHIVTLPGTIQTNRIGQPYTRRLIEGLTPETDYVGPAWFQRDLELSAADCQAHVEVFLERCCWQTFIWLNGTYLGTRDSLVSPHLYDLGCAIQPGTNQLAIMVDNSNQKCEITAPRADGTMGEDLVLESDQRRRLNCGGHHTVFGGFAWNGITGKMEIRIRPQVCMTDVHVYPLVEIKAIRIALTYTNHLEVVIPASVSFVCHPAQTHTPDIRAAICLACEPGQHTIMHELELGENMLLWDEFTPEIYALSTTLQTEAGEDIQLTPFGMRSLSQVGHALAINGRPTFLRGALENFVHPMTGYPPTDTDYWLKIFNINKAHGLNHIRFHTCCPPEAAFIAADQLGILLNVELPGCSGNEPTDAATLSYLQNEALRILSAFGNHPSFLMLTMGNELLYSGEADAESQQVLMNRVARCKEADNRHWYCCTAHPYTEGRDDDFYVSAWPKGGTWENFDEPLTGIRWSGFDVVDSSRFNLRAPETASDYRAGIIGIDKPVITHEVGQWAVYPDVKEAPAFTGVFKAFNLDIIRQFMQEKGTLALADDFVRASGQLSLLLYKEEIESALRTPGLAGFQLLGFHDHPPQGTSTIGIITALRESKGMITPRQFRQFCSETVPLARLAKRTFTSGQTFSADVDVAHFGADDLGEQAFGWRMKVSDGTVVGDGLFAPLPVPRGQLTRLGTIVTELSAISAPAKIQLAVFLPGTEILNTWDFWIYPEPVTEKSTDILWSRTWGKEQVEALDRGATLVLELTEEQIPHATRGCFTTLFWNPIMKRNQKSFTMGILCDPAHPALASFPTEMHTNWQWWDVLRPSRVLNLDGMQPQPTPIVRMVDSFIGNRTLCVVCEARLSNGRILITSLDLTSNLEDRHAARQLRHSLRAYVCSDSFQPQVEITEKDVSQLLIAHQKEEKRETRNEVVERLERFPEHKSNS